MLKTSASYSLISSDAPSLSPEEDEFGYKNFSKIIAEIICHIKTKNGLVLAIHGSWGSGKTSAINYVKHYLREPDFSSTNTEKQALNEEIMIADFNPWWFTNNQNLTNQFLACFTATLCASKLDDSTKEKIKGYANAMLSALAQSNIPIVKDVAVVTKGLADEWQKQTLAGLKDTVTSALADSAQKFVFIIDDIDRLTKDEVRALFKTIKVLVDFPNVIYLLAFDCEVVANSLKNMSGEDDGNAYLEKIVQVPFALPLISTIKFRRIFRERIKAVVSMYESDNRTFKAFKRLNDIYDNGLNQLVRTPRQINRIVNTLSVLYPILRLKVALADIVAMECIRMVLPKLYGVIRDHSDYFVLHTRNFLSKTPNVLESNDETNSFHAAWKEDLPVRYKNSAIKIMRLLFFESDKDRELGRSRLFVKRVLVNYFRLGRLELESPEEDFPAQVEELSSSPQES